MSSKNLFNPLKVGSLVLNNRILMAPLTRCRAVQNHLPNDLMAQYYAQRATAGLIISEATMIQENTSAFITEPGIYNSDMIAGWRKTTNAVHKEGGKIFLQIWHGGRVSHPDMNNGHENVAPSAIAVSSEVYTPKGLKAHATPRALLDSEIPNYINYFKIAATNAKAAGFDGVEIHGANGYLIDQFLRDGSNKRSGPYGGNINNRCRFLFDIISEVSSVFGSDRVGLRLSPLNSFNSMKDSDPVGLTRYISKELNNFNLAYLHIMRSDFLGIQNLPVADVARHEFKGVLIGNMGYSVEEAESAILQNKIDAVAFGRYFISNPNLVQKIRDNRTLTEADQSTFYTGGEKGYTDYSNQ